MDVSGVSIDPSVIRWTLIFCIAVAVGLSIVRRHSERFARERARRALRAVAENRDEA